jgi:hypothetical protein
MLKISLVLVFLLALAPAWSTMAARSPDREPPVGTAAELREFWLKFHESELCQGLDATFVFSQAGVEIWCIVEEDRSFDKLSEMLSPLRARYQVAVYPTRPQPDKRPLDERNPPPSLWTNEELRSSLSDPFAGVGFSEPNSKLRSMSAKATEVLKQRMMMYAEQTLDWNRRLKQYASDLPGLTKMSLDQSLTPETRAHAAAVAVAHAQAVDRLAGRLNDNLIQAFPRTGKRPKAAGIENTENSKLSAVESAQRLSDLAILTSTRIFRFIHPQRHTVGLVDLKEPSLLEALRTAHRSCAPYLPHCNDSDPPDSGA